jgi:hypothetical protein
LVPLPIHPWSPGAPQQPPPSSALALTVGGAVNLDGAAAAREVNILSPQQRKIEFKRVALFNFSDPENAPKRYEAKMNLACYLLLLKDALFGDKTYKERKDMAAANLFDLTGYCLVKGKSRGKQAMAAAAAVVLEGGDDVAEPPKKKAKVTGVTSKIIQAEMLEISGELAHATRRTALLVCTQPLLNLFYGVVKVAWGSLVCNSRCLSLPPCASAPAESTPREAQTGRGIQGSLGS